MFKGWHDVGIVAGTGALSYLAAGTGKNLEQTDLRLSLDKGRSLVGDVRFLGGMLAGVASMSKRVDADTKQTLQAVATASLGSLASTEAVRYRLIRANVLTQGGRIFPQFGAEAPAPAYGTRQAAWANG